jgi:hypothetical protein
VLALPRNLDDLAVANPDPAPGWLGDGRIGEDRIDQDAFAGQDSMSMRMRHRLQSSSGGHRGTARGTAGRGSSSACVAPPAM